MDDANLMTLDGLFIRARGRLLIAAPAIPAAKADRSSLTTEARVGTSSDAGLCILIPSAFD